eukprot:CAMPEP_0194517678 /NCGR_PEP_ID=MMETSP0253-20130528/50923_1 /TAXON_ID=2966 /ORGANISM="Noctiluca scintillans" /LENGTH=134 /DNA_ID=CAMNT_0039361673 /DNA_START=1 /DNA_END=405 /DNA_ORIENTATION=-
MICCNEQLLETELVKEVDVTGPDDRDSVESGSVLYQAAPECQGDVPSGTEFRVELNRSPRAQHLGLKVKKLTESLEVYEISLGLVHEWNLANPELEVRVGDSLVEVNKVRGPVSQHLVDRFREDSHLVLIFVRG